MEQISPDNKIPTLYEVDYDPDKLGMSILIPEPVFNRMVLTRAELLSVLGFGIVKESKVFEDNETLIAFKKNIEASEDEEEYFSDIGRIARKAAKEIQAALRDVEVNEEDGYWRFVFDVEDDFEDLVDPNRVDLFMSSNRTGPHIRVQKYNNSENEKTFTKVRIKSLNIDTLIEMIDLAISRIINQL